mmetsp:Transcript_30543/g.55263  ORF Transcript_30543/g.55263 Transcript_30543/m.55263 type:complete len:108 (-) Transcript_30543:114-437(-)
MPKLPSGHAPCKLPILPHFHADFRLLCGAKHPSLAFIKIECHRFVKQQNRSDATGASGSVPTRTSVALDFPPSAMPMVSFVMVQSDVFVIAFHGQPACCATPASFKS